MKNLTKRKIIILGTGGSSRDILDITYDINAFYGKEIYLVLGFLDDDESKWGKEINGIKILGPLVSAVDYTDAFFINGIGSPKTFLDKQKIISKTNIPMDRFVTLIHPSASISKSAKIGLGSVIFQNVVLGSNVKVGEQVIILPNVVISHDDKVGDFSCLAGCVYISGTVSIGKFCYIGANASIRESLSIGEGSLVGMGSTVIDNVPSRTVFAGNPARFVKNCQ